MIIDYTKNLVLHRLLLIVDAGTGESLMDLKIRRADDVAGVMDVIVPVPGNPHALMLGPDGKVASRLIRRPIRIVPRDDLDDARRAEAEAIVATYRDRTDPAWPPGRLDDLEGLAIGVFEAAAERGHVGMDDVLSIRGLFEEYRRLKLANDSSEEIR